MTDVSGAVSLGGKASGSRALHRIAEELTITFPELAPVPAVRRFRKLYHDWLPEFEASRLMSPRRDAVAKRAAELFVEGLRWRDMPLTQACAFPSDAAELETIQGRGDPAPSLASATGTDLPTEVSQMWERGQCSRAVVDAFEWARDRGPCLDLRGEQFVLLGAGAELAPTELLLAAGAEVLWVDVRDPVEQHHASPGTLRYRPGGLDLLESPALVRATVEAFAKGPIHLGLFAYAAGGAREWRLCATMNALVDALPKELVHSVSMLLSPASPCVAAPFQPAAPTRVVQALPKGRGGTAGAVTRNVVPVQGVSYQAAQYLGKRLTAEAWARDQNRQLRISANMAGITRTRSTQHPLFEAAFAGAPRLGVRIFESELTSRIAAWLMLHDLFGPNASLGLFDKQVHGGVLGLPLSLHRAIAAAATLGLAGRPRIVGQLLRRR